MSPRAQTAADPYTAPIPTHKPPYTTEQYHQQQLDNRSAFSDTYLKPTGHRINYTDTNSSTSLAWRTPATIPPAPQRRWTPTPRTVPTVRCHRHLAHSGVIVWNWVPPSCTLVLETAMGMAIFPVGRVKASRSSFTLRCAKWIRLIWYLVRLVFRPVYELGWSDAVTAGSAKVQSIANHQQQSIYRLDDNGCRGCLESVRKQQKLQ